MTTSQQAIEPNDIVLPFIYPDTLKNGLTVVGATQLLVSKYLSYLANIIMTRAIKMNRQDILGKVGDSISLLLHPLDQGAPLSIENIPTIIHNSCTSAYRATTGGVFAVWDKWHQLIKRMVPANNNETDQADHTVNNPQELRVAYHKMLNGFKAVLHDQPVIIPVHVEQRQAWLDFVDFVILCLDDEHSLPGSWLFNWTKEFASHFNTVMETVNSQYSQQQQIQQ
ncbi:hypothetical protein SAMD00019534_125600 [Acytostelium subglobosum LB1]|uniref:hypothetical protein n=1 Tax=Acytostelium subglobosum LB1 TaxID=1410327 RepID=UPI000644FCE1|nr:hypothetical protein SAMD00019534_125600 [Acytostelium subglobosum LB1]GAM29384.1 hypothetical protein SAMD00019534_125600 [Acytostelium subglobosum LB1]|eukprot:XP_012747652.1 hypothetical protein SAMD00019534_125600 [Acytostelium subglobosum LB1]